MPFRAKQKYKQSVCAPVIYEKRVELELGWIVEKSEDSCKKKLPESELFEINNVLKAGIKLEEVSSTILGSKDVDADKVIRKYTKKNKIEGETVNEK